MMMIVFTSQLPSNLDGKGGFSLFFCLFFCFCTVQRTDFNVKHCNDRLLNKGLIFIDFFFPFLPFSTCAGGESYL